MNTCKFLVTTGMLLGLFSASDVLAQGTNQLRPPFFAVLLGGNEVSSTGQANAGDPDGVGSATILIDTTRLCFGLTVNNIGAPVVAHIHRGVAGVNGPIVVNLIVPGGGNPGASSGCVTVGADLLANIRTNPGLFYVNVHTAAFPGGAVRGQLF